MTAPQLDYPVVTLDNRILLPAGTRLTDETLQELIASNADTAYRKHHFLGFGEIHKDIILLFYEPPYSRIFREAEERFALSLMGKMHVITPVLEIINHLKSCDIYTYRHLLMVFALSTILVRDLIKKSEDWIAEAMAGTLHDIGKICIPLHVLKKTHPLSRTEKNILEHHALAGFCSSSITCAAAGVSRPGSPPNIMNEGTDPAIPWVFT